mmetsp:Transcript_28956/g.27894  ORF Transcript_28956/g.27894 Transcript_28956/m.27894 type:complete len:83 (-) Transcript_28956:5033-5281(-)
MDLELNNSIFNNNQAGYVMEKNFPYNLSSQVQIIGGYNNTIDSCTFDESKGIYSSFIPQKLANYFPEGYFEAQHTSLIAIEA